MQEVPVSCKVGPITYLITINAKKLHIYNRCSHSKRGYTPYYTKGSSVIASFYFLYFSLIEPTIFLFHGHDL